jgi:dipeptidyl aminopeptidase
MTLKTLEMDAGQTFKYGMAVAPVTDWRFYDSVYTERYMHTPQHNPGGYDNATISNMTALSQNVKFLVMHGYSDDNVHFQNTLQLLDKLDQAGVTNYDVHVFPDSDHSIYFHNANRIVYESKHSPRPTMKSTLANNSCRIERLARERFQWRVAKDG